MSCGGGALWLTLLVLSGVAAGAQPPPPRAEPALPAGLEEPAPGESSSPAGPAEPAPEEPALPAGLGDTRDEAPALPAGLDDPDRAPPSGEPSLPSGLGEEPAEEAESGARDRPSLRSRLPSGLSGFVEARAAPRLRDDPVHAEDFALGEGRLQAEYERDLGAALLEARADLVLDAVLDEVDWDQRELRLAFRPGERVDLSVGRQILTWGTGDMLFVNDLFPKDWPSFFSGRDTEYLKAPSDALRIGVFGRALNLDLVYTPQFDPDRYIDGERFSFWSPLAGAPSGDASPLETSRPDDWFEDDEIALRLYRSAASWELAVYGYDGFWKSPGGFDPATGRATFPPLRVAGASARGPLAGGIGSLELGFYDSRADQGGRDPFVNNDELRVLAGWEVELARELTGGFQAYLERLLDYDGYRAALPGGAPRDEDRVVLTVRLTQLLLRQDLTLSWFSYWSPTDEDGYLRPRASYRLRDGLTAEVGLNWFFGEAPWSFFGQFERGSNAYLSLRSSV